ncbi:type IV pilin [Methanosphaerula palustris]|uniref:Cna B domain protein n=1 Tax=Methanosphaerula palustris (strain ATCC BAA-1556 / DSM 19958 / E1-9c) TaxID=521011 RepID=B8GIE3_METPE|nr:type IV pilin [Methanosphaerula palustris]ACL15494.1 hypothetical protein Mpal_0101 [Methanosphaerula palustris E1-9c]
MKTNKDRRGSSGEERQRWHEWGVSEVIGVVLLLSLVVVGGTVVGTQLLSQPAPKEIPNVNFLANYNPGNLTLYHTGGDTLPNGDYKFVVQYLDGTKSQTFNATKDWSSGSPLTFPAVSQPAKVTLVYTGNGAGETALRSVVMGDQGSDVGEPSSGSNSTDNPPSASTHYTITPIFDSLKGSITCNGTSLVNNSPFDLTAGETPTLTFTNIAGFKFDKAIISGDKGASTTVTTSPYRFTTGVDQNYTVTVTFAEIAPPAPAHYTITPIFDSLKGSITCNGTSLVNNSPFDLTAGETPTLTFTNIAGFKFDKAIISGDKGASTTVTTSPYTFSTGVDQNYTVTVTFAEIAPPAPAHYTITPIFDSLKGSITCNGTSLVNNSPFDLTAGETPTLTFTNIAGFKFDKAIITGDKGASTTVTTSPYTFTTGVDQNYTVTVTFAEIAPPAPAHYTITPIFDSLKGSITCNGTSLVNNSPFDLTAGETPTLTFTNIAGFKFDKAIISGDKGASTTVTTSPYTFSTGVDQNYTATVTFTANVYTVNVTSGLNGSVRANDQTVAAGTSGTVNVGYNGEVNFTYLPTTGHHIDTVTYTAEDGSQKQLPIVDNTTSTLPGITSNCTVVATFTVDRFAITVTPPVHGSITPNSTQMVDYNDTPTFTFTPEAGYHLGTVTVDGTSVTPAGNTYTFPPVTGPHTLAATFVVDTFTINASAGDHGTINPNGAVPANYGESKDFTITANTGYHINSVTVDSTPQTIPAGNTSYLYTFTNIQASHTINASFAINTYTINATAGDHGTITPNGTQTANYGDSRTFTITPATGYTIADVTVDGVSQGAVTTYALTNIQGDHTITATFTQVIYTITANTGPLGTITPSGSLGYAYHAIPSFTVSAIPGYHIVNIIVDGAMQGPAPNYTFAPLEANHTITADFAKNVYTITATAGSGGSITPAGITSVNYGDNQVYTIAAGSGNTIDDVVVDGISIGQASSFNFTQVNGNHTIQAYFDINGVGPYSIAGYIWNDQNNNGVWDSGEPPLAGWTVQAQGKGTAQDWHVVNQTVSDSTGYYIISNLPKDHYHVVEVQQSGWNQTYPISPKYYDVENLNQGRADKHQQVTGDNFGNHMTATAGNQILLNNPMNIGVLKDGTYIRFTGTTWREWPQPAHTDDWIEMDSSATLASGLDIVSGNKFRIPWQTQVTIMMDGDQANGQIYISNTQISTYQFDHVKVYFNGNLVATGKITGIWVNGYTNWQSTLTYVMSSYNSGAQFVVNGTNIINPPWWPYQDWGVNVYAIAPQSAPYSNVLNFNYQNGRTYLVCSGTYDLFTA